MNLDCRNLMVEQVDRQAAVLEALSDDYARRILLSTLSEAKSIEEISHENDIPISTCYRRVRELLDMQILRLDRTIITATGKKFETYRTRFSGATIVLSPDGVSVDVTFMKREPEKRLQDMLQAMGGK